MQIAVLSDLHLGKKNKLDQFARNPGAEERLYKLLNYSQEVNLKNSKYKVTIAPRIGTISPWSSKASDICKICGLSIVSRLERGINYHFDRTINTHELVTILELVMDKMTESHLNNINDSYMDDGSDSDCDILKIISNYDDY